MLKKGFTLIELIVTTTIIILFSALSLASYNQFSQDRQLESDSGKFLAVLELAKKKAAGADISACSTQAMLTPAVSKYSVVVDSATTYRLLPGCTVTTPTPILYRLQTNVSFAVTPYPSIDFGLLTSGATSSCIILKNSANEKCRYVKVETSGTICEGGCSLCSSCSCPSC